MRLFLILAVLVLGGVAQTAPIVLDDCDSLEGWKVVRKPATLAPADSAAEGKGALAVSFPGQILKTYGRNYLPGSAVWDSYDGISFMVKGDGSEQFGSLAVKGRYSFVTFFPLLDTRWHRVVVPWSDFIPEGNFGTIGTFGAMPPSGITAIRLGTRWTIWHNNDKIPKHSYCIDQIQLVKDIPANERKFKPRPFAEILKLLHDGKPLRIQCMGDSITAGTGLSDKNNERYAVLLQKNLRQWLKNDGIVSYSRAVGGARLTDARSWVGRDFRDDPPDLVTIWYGYNDKSGAFPRAFFRFCLEDYIARVTEITKGKTAFLLFATGPGCGPRFTMLDDFAETVREIAREQELGCFDINRLLKEIGREKMENYFGDMAHPNSKGHRFIAARLADFLVDAAGITTPKPVPPKIPIGKASSWDFGDGAAGWIIEKPDVDCVAGETGKLLKFTMPAKGRDHRRAWSPSSPVRPGQSYSFSARILMAKPLTEGHAGMYACFYKKEDASDAPKLSSVASIPARSKDWRIIKGSIQIPPGVARMKVIVWSSVDSVGEFLIDDVKVIPIATEDD